VSKRHQSNRRKSYGRRQHEVAERRHREPEQDALALTPDDLAADAQADGFTFLDSRTAGLYYAMAD
jgi:hypothetical protein